MSYKNPSRGGRGGGHVIRLTELLYNIRANTDGQTISNKNILLSKTVLTTKKGEIFVGIRMDIKRTDFYCELPNEKRKQFFDVKMSKFLPAVDNIYYGVYLEDDFSDNPLLKPFFDRLKELKQSCTETRKPQPFGNGLLVDLLSYSIYKYCITNPDLYDIFLVDYLPNDGTPRIMVQIRAYGLWLHGEEKMTLDSYNTVAEIFGLLGMTTKLVRENRLDYAYHTNSVQKPERILSDSNLKRQFKTTLTKWHGTGDVYMKDGEAIFKKDYFALGQRKSNDVFVRFYNKALEVIEQGYKGFFFEIWRQMELISFYDEYCFNRALAKKSYDYVHRAKLEFYLEYGTDKNIKREILLTFEDKNATARDFANLSSQFMPELTTVYNIEFQTKRTFYRGSDKFIDSILQEAPERENVPEPLKRIFKIIDNRSVFLEYLTRKTVCFKKADGEYAAWWKRLRNTKLGGLDLDIKLVREYSHKLDEELARKKFVNTVATNAVYGYNVGTDFIEDVGDLICKLNDNDVRKLRVNLYDVNSGAELDKLYGSALAYYELNKLNKFQKLKNRIRETRGEEAVPDIWLQQSLKVV